MSEHAKETKTDVNDASFTFNVQDALPDGYRISTDTVWVSTDDIPVTSVVNGKKVQIGMGSIDPETGVFTANLGSDNAHASILVDQIKGKDFSGLVQVSEAQVLPSHSIFDATLHSLSLQPGVDPSKGVHPIGVPQSHIDHDLTKNRSENKYE